MTTIGHKHDHMDALNRYKDYKKFWDKHRIPGEYKDKKLLWIDPGYETFRQKQRKIAERKSAQKIKSSKKDPRGGSVSESISSKSSASTPTKTTMNNSAMVGRMSSQEVNPKDELGAAEVGEALNDSNRKQKQRHRKNSSSSQSSSDSDNK